MIGKGLRDAKNNSWSFFQSLPTIRPQIHNPTIEFSITWIFWGGNDSKMIKGLLLSAGIAPFKTLDSWPSTSILSDSPWESALIKSICPYSDGLSLTTKIFSIQVFIRKDSPWRSSEASRNVRFILCNAFTSFSWPDLCVGHAEEFKLGDQVQKRFSVGWKWADQQAVETHACLTSKKDLPSWSKNKIRN